MLLLFTQCACACVCVRAAGSLKEKTNCMCRISQGSYWTMDGPAEVPQVRAAKRPYPEEDEEKPQVLALTRLIPTFDLVVLAGQK